MIHLQRNVCLGITFLCVAGILSMHSCSTAESIASKTFESTCWDITDTLGFSLHPSQLGRDSELNIEVTFLPDYRYSNLYLKAIATSPSGAKQEIMVNDTVIDPAGNWLTEASGGTYLHPFDTPLRLALEEAGQYQIQLIQYMRDSSLCEIQGVRVW
ncbi:MAG: hypothetical protein AAF587_01955 [Bacteroidota bacterium]